MNHPEDDMDLSDSGPAPLYQDTTQLGLARLERKVDKIAAILNKFILVEERQSIQREEIDELAKDIKALVARVEANERKIDKWINLGVGGWTVIIVLWSIYTVVYKP
jgi:glucose-6-phosphate isomerase